MSQELKAQEKKTYSSEELALANIETQSDLPDLSQATKHIIPLSIEYWKPENEGEEKLVYVHSVGFHEVPDMETGEVKDLECVMLLEPEEDGKKIKRFIQAGIVLVGNIKDAISRGEIIPCTTLTPVSIVFMGKRANRSNGRASNYWEITPLILTMEG